MLNSIDQAIKNRFGSKRGLLKASRYRASMLFGAYGPYRQLDFGQINRLILICSGNICRSALAQVVAESVNVPADSYGLHCRGGDPADPRAIAYAESIGLDLSSHITKNIKDYQAKPGDLLVGMEPRHVEALRSILTPGTAVTLAGLWLPNPSPYIHDPHNSNDKFFRDCENLVAESTRNLAKRIEPQYAASR